MAVKPAPELKPNYRDKGRRKSRADRLAPGSTVMSDDELDTGEGDKGEREYQERYAAITSAVMDDIREAITARETSGIEELWMEDDDQYNGTDEMGGPYGMVKVRGNAARGADNDGRSRVFVPITKPKTDVGVARVSEMLLPSDDRPWDIQPSPVPDLEEHADSDAPVTLADGTQATAAQVVAMHKARNAEICKAEADWIEDRFQEGDVYSHMRQVLRDAGRIGTGVIKGPFPVRRTIKKWEVKRQAVGQPATGLQTLATPTQPVASGNVATPPAATPPTPTPMPAAQTPVQMATQVTLRVYEKTEPTSVCVRVQDCYPDPSCGDSIHDGGFFVEREFATAKKLRELAQRPGYDPIALVEAIKEGPGLFTRRHDNTYRPRRGDTNADAKLYEIYNYYGELSPEAMETLTRRQNKYPDDPDDDQQDANDEKKPEHLLSKVLTEDQMRYLRSVPVVVSMLNNRCIKCVVSPDESGEFPFDFMPWEPIKGQPYGRGIPRKMAVAQRILNASVRALLENAGLSAGAQIVIQKGAITPWNGKNEVVGRKGWNFEPQEAGQDPDVRKSFAVFSIPSVTEEMLKIIQLALDLADQLTNLPMLIQGDQQAGTSPETLGGMKMLMANAMSPLRTVAKLSDDRLFSPHTKRYHDYGMQHGPDNIKGGDTQIVAKGSTVLIQREEGREFLAQVFPVKDDPTLRIDPNKLIKEMARANGFDMSAVQYTDDEWKEKQAEMAKQPPPVAPAVEAAQIRSQALVQQQQLKNEDMQAARQLQKYMADMDARLKGAIAEVNKQIAEMDLAGKSNLSLMNIKAQLAMAAQDNALKADEMQFKLDPMNKSHTGI